uniref:Type II secretion system protein GspF domain-containing protein n=1 Tax=Fervidicoccus fontis TaxID=683846 RepID=A0A7J3ZIW8_9CREN
MLLKRRRRVKEIELRDAESLGAGTIFLCVAIIAAGSLSSILYMHFTAGLSLASPREILFSHSFIVGFSLSLIAGHMLMAIRTRYIIREVSLINSDLSVLVGSLATGLRTGSDFRASLSRAIPRLSSPVLRHRISMLINLLSQVDLETALQKTCQGLPERAKNVLRTLIPISESGGKSADVAEVVSEFARRLGSFDRIKGDALKPYLYIVLLAIGVFEAGTLFMLYLALALYGGETSLTGQAGLLQPMIPIELTWVYLYYANLTIVFLASLFISKILRASIKYYSGYFVVMCALHFVLLGIVPMYALFF